MYYSQWEDEFDSDCPNATKLYDLAVGQADKGEYVGNSRSKEDFIEGKFWKSLRRLAALALEESGLPPHPVPEQINFHKYIEIIED